MSLDSRLRGFHKLSVEARLAALVEMGAIPARDRERLLQGRALLTLETADKMIENVIGVFGLPFAVAPNFSVNGIDRLVPMVVEEPSIVAALSSAAKRIRAGGGFSAHAETNWLAGQIQLIDVDDADAAVRSIREEETSLVAAANELIPTLVARGGGCKGLELYKHQLEDRRWTVIVHVLVDTCDAMGANVVNTLCEGLSPNIARTAGGRVALRILSNLADHAVVSASCTLPLASLATGSYSAEDVRDGIVLATQTANASPHRAATHNKGIMNGVDAVAIATGNDWRAIEAGAHAFAVRGGSYRSLTDWRVTESGDLHGTIRLPLKVGTVGGSLRANPGAALGTALTGVETAPQLAELMASVGLAQNFAALRALVTHGIQRGHMRLHARSVAATAGVPEEHFAAVVAGMLASGDVKVWKAKELSAELLAKPQGRSGDSARLPGRGAASAKVILLGEHGVVYGREALAVPLPNAMTARIGERDGASSMALSERGAEREIDLAAPDGAATILRLILERLGITGRSFDVEIESRIPLAMGLGGSAALAVALIRAFNDLLELGMDDRAVDKLAFECEQLSHGTPSGIDNNLATYGETVLYSKGARIRTKPIQLKRVPPIVVASSGVRGATREQVANVRKRRAQNEPLYDSIFDEMGEISAAGAAALRDEDYEALGLLMNVCHGLLSAIQVSHPTLEAMVDTARRAGAVGAKLTGAGGGGSIVALCPEKEDAVTAALRDEGYVVMRLRF